jgi:hypothetical protein
VDKTIRNQNVGGAMVIDVMDETTKNKSVQWIKSLK